MKRVALSFVSSSLNRFGAYSKRLYSSSPSLQPQIPAHKSNGFSQEFRFTCGVAVGFSAVAGTALGWEFKSRLAEQELQRDPVKRDKLKFKEWMRKYGRVYKDENEKQKRFLIFQQNLRGREKVDNHPMDWSGDLTLHETQEKILAKIPIEKRTVPRGSIFYNDQTLVCAHRRRLRRNKPVHTSGKLSSSAE